ncbi:hypothetical protein BZA05DRAFT_455786, partial [Tricharina praecox]|uniref:uncharacterized protein n=1 Tax=Tricharina praecox TaxID=43433 RepID=UPI00221F2DC2
IKAAHFFRTCHHLPNTIIPNHKQPQTTTNNHKQPHITNIPTNKMFQEEQNGSRRMKLEQRLSKFHTAVKSATYRWKCTNCGTKNSMATMVCANTRCLQKCTEQDFINHQRRCGKGVGFATKADVREGIESEDESFEPRVRGSLLDSGTPLGPGKERCFARCRSGTAGKEQKYSLSLGVGGSYFRGQTRNPVPIELSYLPPILAVQMISLGAKGPSK